MWKTIGIISTIIFAIIAASIGYGKLYANQTNTSKQVEKVEVEVKEVKKDVTENSAVNREQAIILKQTVEILNKMELRMK